MLLIHQINNAGRSFRRIFCTILSTEFFSEIGESKSKYKRKKERYWEWHSEYGLHTNTNCLVKCLRENFMNNSVLLYNLFFWKVVVIPPISLKSNILDMISKLGTITKYDKVYNNKVSIAKDRKHTKSNQTRNKNYTKQQQTTKDKTKAKQSA